MFQLRVLLIDVFLCIYPEEGLQEARSLHRCSNIFSGNVRIPLVMPIKFCPVSYVKNVFPRPVKLMNWSFIRNYHLRTINYIKSYTVSIVRREHSLEVECQKRSFMSYTTSEAKRSKTMYETRMITVEQTRPVS